jgi:excisionase family DNA binding protein
MIMDMKKGGSDEFYRAEELADTLKLNIMTIYRYIKAGRLRAYKIGKEYRIDKAEFQAFLKKVSTK